MARTCPPGTPGAGVEKLNSIKKEADLSLAETVHQVSLTVKHGNLILFAGIDKSNFKDQSYILFPKNPYVSTAKIGKVLRAHYQIKNPRIILTDSHATPLRNGDTGVRLAHYGFKAVQNLVGQPDLFGREVKMTQVNLHGALSVAAVFQMAETSDSCPLVILEKSGIEFTDRSSVSKIQIPLDEDPYESFFKSRTNPD